MASSEPLPRITVLALGGTIAMRPDTADGGAVPKLSATGLIGAVPQLASLARLEAETLRNLPSASLEITDVLQVAQVAARACAAVADGVVVTQGTDTLEESAYLLDAVWERPEPIVVTGAMRVPSAAGADGPANLLGAVRVAGEPAARSRGCLVVMNDEVHAARDVRKRHTTSTAAFGSPLTGPTGSVVEEKVRFRSPPTPRRTVQPVDGAAVPRVALLRICLGQDSDLLDVVGEHYDALVIESLGAGHVPEWWNGPLLRLARRMPVVLASRVEMGPLLRSTYGFVGSERQLLRGGLLHAGELDGLKARLLLIVLLMADCKGENLRRRFEQLTTT